MFCSPLMTGKNTGWFLGAADFLDQLEQLIGTSVRRKKGGWQKGKKRK
jgi:hypothetical protein